jgi:branched-chain amino acid transport system ATP-binding protein
MAGNDKFWDRGPVKAGSGDWGPVTPHAVGANLVFARIIKRAITKIAPTTPNRSLKGTDMAILEIKHVSKFFGGLAANADVSFTMTQGMIMGLIGPNGAGKTTLFNCITGYYPPSKGEVLFKGKLMNGLEPDRVCKLGMARTWQKVRPLAKMSVVDNVMVGALCRTGSLKKARELAMVQIRVVKLEHKANVPAGGLTIGERKKLEVARVLATRPELLLLDEVMGGLNPAESEEIIQLILEIKRQGVTQMVIEHDMKAIMRISDRIVVLNSGEKLTEGSPQEVVNNPEVVKAYLGDFHA